MIEEQKGKWDGKMSADSMLKEGRGRREQISARFGTTSLGDLIGFHTEMQLIGLIGGCTQPRSAMKADWESHISYRTTFPNVGN